MFTITWTETAFKQLNKLHRIIAKSIYKKIDELKENPRGSQVKKLVGRPYYRLRVGDYRIIFDIQEQNLVILIIEIGHRKKVYK